MRNGCLDKGLVVGIIGLLIIATCLFSVTANPDMQLKKDMYNIEVPSSLDLPKDGKLDLVNSKVLKEKRSCEHFAYYSSSDELCWIYKVFLTPPYNSTCVCGGLSSSMPFFSSGTWTIEERLLVTEYSNGALWEIDLENCDLIEIGGGGVGLNGLTYDPTSGNVYGCSSYDLYQIDPETGEQESIGSFNTGNTMIEIACDTEGVMYGWDVKFSGESYLYEINKYTGEASIVAGMDMTLSYAHDGDFCRECDILYLAADGNLIECDEDTGECEILGSLNNYEGFFIIPDQWNLQPITEFDWTPQIPEPGEEIIFNASDSYDPDGYITLYEWDWDNDGIYDENHTNPIATHIWYDIGEYPVTLRVTDNDGLTGIKTKYVLVWMIPIEPPHIDGPTSGKVGVEYDYTFIQTNPDADDISYFIDWGDNTTTGWTEFYPAGEMMIRNHTWYEKGVYTIRAKVKDPWDRESDWNFFEVTMPRTKAIANFLVLWFLERFPLFERLLNIFGWNIV